MAVAVSLIVPGLVAVLLRARFLTAPLTVDEGGYLAVARAWAGGRDLYAEVWVDRPQGLLVLFRGLHSLGLGTPVGVRLLAVAACVVGALACGHVAARLADERARLPAGLFAAVLLSLPQIEGHTANAELLSASLGAVSLALCLEGIRRPAHVGRWMLAAGVAGGVALSVKQSAFDAVGTGVVAIAVLAPAGAAPVVAPARRIRAMTGVAVGGAIPVVLCAVHGAVTGWDRWWFAVAGYRLAARSALVDARYERIAVVWDIVRPAVVGLLVVLVVGGVWAVVSSAASRRAAVVLVSWAVFAAGAFVLGGQFFRHYWTILVFPIAAATGAVVGSLRVLVVRAGLTLAVCVGPVLMAVGAMTVPRDQLGVELHDDGRLVRSEAVARWYRETADVGDGLYVMCVSAAVYGNADVDPPYPYLWWDGIRQIPGATDLLVAMLADPDRPRFLAVFQSAASCDSSGRVAALVEQNYIHRTVVDGVVILEAAS